MKKLIKNLVLNDIQIRQKIRRIAFAILESHYTEKSIVLAGIDGQGFVLTQRLAKELSIIAPFNLIVVRATLDKQLPRIHEVTLDKEIKSLQKKSIILIDDVLNTGKTLAYGLTPFLSIEIKKIEVAVLVNRQHSLFPIQPNYTGYELATTLSNRIEVILNKKSAVYLY